VATACAERLKVESHADDILSWFWHEFSPSNFALFVWKSPRQSVGTPAKSVLSNYSQSLATNIHISDFHQ